ncbi:MAG: 50S ribosomal protein L11 methyltransferase [Pseudomonadota bacterium]
MPNHLDPPGPDGPPAWLEVSLVLEDQAQGRRACRLLRRAGARHLWQGSGLLRALWPDTPRVRAELAGLAAEPGLPVPRMEAFQAPDPLVHWQAPPRDQVHPRLALAPAWAGVPAGPGVLVIDPLTAFGAGDHPSTRLNLWLLAEALAEGGLAPGARAADVGAGSGVLALALVLLGGLQVLALDPDPASQRAVERNRRLNPLAGPGVRFIRDTHQALAGRFPLIAANLPGPLLLVVAPRLAACLEPGGDLVVSGFRREFAPRVEEAYAARGVAVAVGAWQGDWVGLRLRRGGE